MHPKRPAKRVSARLSDNAGFVIMANLAKALQWAEGQHQRAQDGRFGSQSGVHAPPKAAGAEGRPTAPTPAPGQSGAPAAHPVADTAPLPPSVQLCQAFPLGSADNPTTAERDKMAQKAQKQRKDDFASRHSDPAYAGRFTSQERSAVVAYAANADPSDASSFMAINNALLGRSSASLAKQTQSRRAAAVINQAISHSVLKEPTVLYRGGFIPEDVKVGDVMSSPGVTSTSGDKKAAAKFIKDEPHHGLLVIQAQPGACVLDMNKGGMSIFQGEQEMLLGSHQRLYVSSVKTDPKGRRVVTVSTEAPAGRKEDAMAKSEGAARRAKASGPKVSKHFGGRVAGDAGLKIVHRPQGAPKNSPVGQQPSVRKSQEKSAAPVPGAPGALAPNRRPALRKAQGAGSRGGVIIGYTRSQKPVYQGHRPTASAYKDFTADDHQDAGALHHAHLRGRTNTGHLSVAGEAGPTYAAQKDTADGHFKRAYSVGQKAAAQAHTASLHVLGHTGGGHPVYAGEPGSKARYAKMTPQDHADAADLHRKASDAETDKHRAVAHLDHALSHLRQSKKKLQATHKQKIAALAGPLAKASLPGAAPKAAGLKAAGAPRAGGGAKLTSHEKNAVTAWVHGFHHKNPNPNEVGALVTAHNINQHLAGKPANASSSFEQAHIAKTAGHINSAIAKQSTAEHKVVYRGTSLHRTIRPGQVLSSPRITSHSEDKAVAEDFARSGKGKRHRYVFEVHAPAGSKMMDISQHKDKRLGTGYSSEKEHTFGSHQQFRIHSMEHRDGVTHVVAHALLDHERVKRPVVRKSLTPPTLGAYQAALAASSAPGHLSDDDKYAMDAYRRMFERAHNAMAQAQAEALARQLAWEARHG